MTFVEYIRRAGRGELKRLERVTGVSYTTLQKLSRGELVKNVDIARAVSRGTDRQVPIYTLLGISESEVSALTGGGLEDWFPKDAS